MEVMEKPQELTDEALPPEASAPTPQTPAPDEPLLPPEDTPPTPRRRHKAEWIMLAIAVAAAAVLIAVAVLCIPYYASNEDPEALPDYHQQNLPQATVPALQESQPEETQPENPTIPPERNPYDRYDFQYNRQNYLVLQNLESYPGVDVSAHQGSIDWRRVRNSGIDFAMIRLGYRGYGSGKLVEDEYAKKNLNGAKAAGLKIGAYFFSQALSIQEADEEIRFMLDILGEQSLDMPIILDWEIPAQDARTAKGMDARTLTDIQLHFCKVMSDKGYKPMVYFNWHQSENLYYLSELEDYPFWLALYQDRMTYPWRVEMWQYSDNGRVPGISGPVDLNVYMPN